MATFGNGKSSLRQKNKGKPLFGPGNMRYITVFPFAGPGRNGGAILMSHLER
jgi:hypothetical protein